MLVYEFMSNGTLREWISGKESSEIFVLKLEMSSISSLNIYRLLYVGYGYELFSVFIFLLSALNF
jgi:hypothetical protein